MVSPQASSYFNLGIQVASRGMLADSARVQTSAVGQCEQHENFVKKHQWFTQRRLLSAKHRHIPSNAPPYSLTGTLTLLIDCTVKLFNKGKLRHHCNAACKNITSYMFAHFMDSIIVTSICSDYHYLYFYLCYCNIFDGLRDLVPFVQFKRREKCQK